MTIAELIELYAYAEAIVETVREPLVILDKDLKIKSVNKGFLKTFRITYSKTVGKKFFELGNGQWDIPSLRILLERVLPRKLNFDDFLVVHNFPDIGKKTMLLNARCVVLSEHRTRLILVAIEDITERKMIEKRTEKFISMASHEIRTPITSIKTFLQILEKRLRDGMDKPTTDIMSRVMHQLNMLNDLVRDLFDARKVKEGTLLIRKKVQKIDTAVKEAVSSFQYITDSHTINLSGKTDTKVFIDKERIIQVVTNILSNAVNYSPGKKNIDVRLYTEGKYNIVSIRDFGVGISQKDQENIFDEYYSENKRSNRTGLGLGLYICSEIIRLHNGKIWVESRLNKGSTFYFSIPIRK